MTKYDAFLIFLENEPNRYIIDIIDDFEIAWESGEFNEEPKGECCG